MRKAIWYVLAVLLCLAVAGGIALQTFVNGLEPRARQRVVTALQNRFDADVQLKSLDLSLFPEPNVVGEGLVISHKQWSDSTPLISIRRFAARTDFLTVLNRKNHVDFVRLEGLEIHVPPRGSSASKESVEANHTVESGEPGSDKTQLQFLIQTIVADGTVLEIEPKEPGKDPLRFDIKELTLHSVGPGQPMAFDALLTNAKPPGLIDSTGRFGPWQKDDPRSTPVSGDYKFEHADLGVFKGIRGILSSVGKYHGVLQHIEVDGTTDTPDFALKRGGSPVHLKTKFHSVVNG